MALQQGGTVAEYREMFESLVASLSGIPEKVYKSAFLNGLREDVRVVIKMHRPISLLEIMDLAQQVEDRLEAVNRVQKGRPGRSNRVEYWSKPGYNTNPSFSKILEGSLQSQTLRDPTATQTHRDTWRGGRNGGKQQISFPSALV